MEVFLHGMEVWEWLVEVLGFVALKNMPIRGFPEYA